MRSHRIIVIPGVKKDSKDYSNGADKGTWQPLYSLDEHMESATSACLVGINFSGDNMDMCDRE